MQIDIEKYERRCPRLGGPVPFTYCESCAEQNSHCFKILDCWWERFDVVGYLKKTLTPTEFDRIARTKPQPKVASLIELIQKAKNNVAK